MLLVNFKQVQKPFITDIMVSKFFYMRLVYRDFQALGGNFHSLNF
jgi:hypothetical protein